MKTRIYAAPAVKVLTHKMSKMYAGNSPPYTCPADSCSITLQNHYTNNLYPFWCVQNMKKRTAVFQILLNLNSSVHRYYLNMHEYMYIYGVKNNMKIR